MRLNPYALIALLLALCTPAAAEDLADRLDELAKAYVTPGHIKNMVVGVIPGPGKPAVVRGYGQSKPDGDTVYEIGSMSKVFTGILLAHLVEEKKLRLDQPLQDFLPEGVKTPAAITLLQLSTHTSGLPRMPDNFNPKDTTNPYVDYTLEQMHAFLPLAKLGPREFAYSNYGVALLGQALQTATKKTYEQLLLERIAQPLGMASTRITLTDEMKKRMAPGHGATGLPARSWDLPTFAAAGAIRSTINDLLKFAAANLDAKEGPLHLAQQVHYKGSALSMGLGWIQPKDGSHFHNGQTGGYHSYLALDLKEGIAIVILGGTASQAVDKLGADIWVMLHDTRKEVAVDEQTLKRYVGRYELKEAPGFILTVTVEDGKLMVQGTGQPKLQVFPESKTKFFYKVVAAQVSFVEQEGKITKLILHQNGDHEAKRLP